MRRAPLNLGQSSWELLLWRKVAIFHPEKKLNEATTSVQKDPEGEREEETVRQENVSWQSEGKEGKSREMNTNGKKHRGIRAPWKAQKWRGNETRRAVKENGNKGRGEKDERE